MRLKKRFRVQLRGSRHVYITWAYSKAKAIENVKKQMQYVRLAHHEYTLPDIAKKTSVERARV